MTDYKQLLRWLIGKEPRPEREPKKTALDKVKIKYEKLPSERLLEKELRRRRRAKASKTVQKRG